MVNKSVPYSKAQQLTDISLSKGYTFTYTAFVEDKKQLYKDINKRLIILETSLNKDNEELESIYSWATELLNEEREEVFLRLNWLKQLYKIKDEIEFVDTKEKVNQLRRSISTVQTCPMKKQIMSELDELEQLLPEEELTPNDMSTEQLLMEKSIEEAGEVFINLGKSGREFVISNVLKQNGENATIESIRESSFTLENRIKKLIEIDDLKEFIDLLEQLPIRSFSSLNGKVKKNIAKQLIEVKGWNGFASLERRIEQLAMQGREEKEDENIIKTSIYHAAITLDINIGKDTKEESSNYYKVII